MNNLGFHAVFTNLGARARLGPTLLGNHYKGKDHEGQVTLVSGIQKWKVPHTGDYRVEAHGAAGGYANSPLYKGRGARMIGTFALIKGETIQILVGQKGGYHYLHCSIGGGGGSFVVRGTNTPLIIAGGGGGVNSVTSRHPGCDASNTTMGNTGHKSWIGGSDGHGAKTAENGSSSGKSDLRGGYSGLSASAFGLVPFDYS